MTTINYCAFLVDQRKNGAPKFCVFYAPVKEVLEWGLIAPLSSTNPGGVQREPTGTRVNSIAHYFQDDRNNTIPTAIVVAFTPGKVKIRPFKTARKSKKAAASAMGSTLVQLSLSWDKKKNQNKRANRPAYIIDGQHRLKGVAQFDSSIPLPIVGILEADDDETAFQFLVINNKQSKVSPNHVRALAFLSKINKQNLEKRLNTARLSLNENYAAVGFADKIPGSPFKGIIKWPPNPKKRSIVVPAAIELSIGHIRQRGGKDLAEPEEAQAFFLAIWNVIKDKWPKLWNSNTHLLEKVSIVCLTEFITDTLLSWAGNPNLKLDISDEASVKENVQTILDNLNAKFFEADWSGRSYDTGAGRDLIRDAIELMYKNKAANVPWYDGVKVLSDEWLATAITGKK